VFNDHVTNRVNGQYACIYMILFFSEHYGLYGAVAFRGNSSNPLAKTPVPALVAT
jgi:1,2-phenylacetyl-CoA epoxidase catalytic subunit